MELAQFNEQDMKESMTMMTSKTGKHANTDVLIEPWANNKISNNKTLSFRKEFGSKTQSRGQSERKRTMDERIEEMYHKYSKQGISGTRQNIRANSRQVYREMLKQFQKAQEFKQLGSRRQQSQVDFESSQFSLEMMKKKVNSYSCAYDYKEIKISQSPPKKEKTQTKCAVKFQRMMKIRDKIRKKNSLTVSKQKEKYLSEYNPVWLYSTRQSKTEVMSKRQKEEAKMKLRMRDHSKSSNMFEQAIPRIDFQVIGAHSNSLQYTVKRNNNHSSNGFRGIKYKNAKFNQTFHSLLH